MIAATLMARGYEVVALPVDWVVSLDGFEAVIIGGALYSNLWPSKARRFVNRNLRALRRVPVWMFSSGPLDASADGKEIPPTRIVGILAERVGALGHVTFGGRLDPDAKGFPARAMAKTRSGDWRNPERIHAWAVEIADAVPDARPGLLVPQPAQSVVSLLGPAIVGGVVCAGLLSQLMKVMPVVGALAIHALVAPVIFTTMALGYFRNRGAREPLPTAIAWTAIAMAMDVAVMSGVGEHGFAMGASAVGSSLPFLLIFAAVWATGYLIAMLPSPVRPHA